MGSGDRREGGGGGARERDRMALMNSRPCATRSEQPSLPTLPSQPVYVGLNG